MPGPRVANNDFVVHGNYDAVNPDRTGTKVSAVYRDLAFHCIPLAQVDPDFAKEQLTLLLREWYMHPKRAAAGL
jgi:hypothetical protein